MAPMILYTFMLLAISCVAVNCGISSASSGASSSSDGTGHTYTQTTNDGQGVHSSTINGQPGPSGTINVGNPIGAAPGYFNPAFNNPGFNNPSYNIPGYNNPSYNNPGFNNPGFNNPGFNNPGFGTYGPAFGYQPFPNPLPPFQSFVPSAPFGFPAPFAPQPLLTPEEFNQQISSYLHNLQQQYEALYKRQQALVNAWKDAQSQAYFGSHPSSFGYATGSYGPGGVHQTVGIHPTNKDKQNVDSRISLDENSAFQKPGFFGISTSAFSSSSDVNGIKSHKEGGVTTINDNGKITTYKIDS